MKYSRNIIIAISLTFALVYFLLLGLNNCIYNESYIPSDGHSYMYAANLLFNNFTPHQLRPLGFAFILGLPNLIFEAVTTNQYIRFSIILNIFAWLGTIILLHKTLLLFLGKKTSFWFTLLFIFCIGNIAIVFQTLTESISTFLLMYMTYYFFNYVKSQNFTHLITGVSFLNILILIKPGFFYVAILASLIIIISVLIKKHYLKLLNIPFILSILFVLIQLFSIYQTYGNIVPSYTDKNTWYFYLGAQAKSKTTKHNYIDERIIRRQLTKNKPWNEQSLISKNDMLFQIKNNTKNVFNEYFKNILENSSKSSYSLEATKRINKHGLKRSIVPYLSVLSRFQNLFFVLLAVLSFIGFLYYRKQADKAVVILLITIFYVILTSGISFWQGDRFNIILYPLILSVFLYLASFNTFLQQKLRIKIRGTD